MLDFEDTFLDPIPSKYNQSDEELGFLPMLAAAVPMVASLAGSLMAKKSSKGGGPPPEAGQAQNVLDILTKAVGGNTGEGENTIKEVVRNIVSSVPSPVLAQVKAAIAEMKNQENAGKQKTISLVNKIDSQFKPQVTAMLAALKAQQLQTQATDEHRRLVADDSYKKRVITSMDAMATRLHRIEQRFKRSALVKGENRIALLGGRGVLER